MPTDYSYNCKMAKILAKPLKSRTVEDKNKFIKYYCEKHFHGIVFPEAFLVAINQPHFSKDLVSVLLDVYFSCINGSSLDRPFYPLLDLILRVYNNIGDCDIYTIDKDAIIYKDNLEEYDVSSSNSDTE